MGASGTGRMRTIGMVRGHLSSVQAKVSRDCTLTTKPIAVGLDPAARCWELRQRQG
jgi:hypothetical protein